MRGFINRKWSKTIRVAATETTDKGVRWPFQRQNTLCRSPLRIDAVLGEQLASWRTELDLDGEGERRVGGKQWDERRHPQQHLHPKCAPNSLARL